MRARFDGVCIKCGEPIKGFQTHPNNPDDIMWTRKPRIDGLRSAAWHSECNYKQDNAAIVASLLAKQRNTPAPVPSIQDAIESKLENIADYKPLPAHSGDFLEGMAQALAPHLTGKIDANIAGITAKVDAKLANLEPMLQAMVDRTVKTIVIENKERGTIVDVGSQHEQFESLLTLVMNRMDTYLYGEPGTGKSSAGEYIAKALELPFGYISLTIQTAESKLVGYMDAHGNYIKTEFYERYTTGGVFLIDEIDNASGNLLTSLNSALANGNGAFPCGQVKRHPDFICIATGNTTGFGHNPMFPERQVLSGAIRDRFVFLQWTYDETFERELALAQHDNKERTNKWVAWVQSVRKYAKQNDPKLPVTPRASIKGARLLDEFHVTDVANMLVFRGYDVDSVSRILKNNPLPVCK